MQRIASRDRTYERDMDRAYIDELNQAYENFFVVQHQGVRVLAIDTDDLNYIANPEDLKWVEDRIRQTLKMPPYQGKLPLEIEGID